MKINLFQFHKGTIRTQFGALPYKLNVYFNSIKVRLELIHQLIVDIVRQISIP